MWWLKLNRTFTAFYLFVRIVRIVCLVCVSRHLDFREASDAGPDRHSATHDTCESSRRTEYDGDPIFECRKCQRATLEHFSETLFFLFLRSNRYPFTALHAHDAHFSIHCIEVPDFYWTHRTRLSCRSMLLACKVIRFVRKYRRTNVVSCLCHIKLLCLFDSFDSARHWLVQFRCCCCCRRHFHLRFTYLLVSLSLLFRYFVSFVKGSKLQQKLLVERGTQGERECHRP